MAIYQRDFEYISGKKRFISGILNISAEIAIYQRYSEYISEKGTVISEISFLSAIQ
ncbi:hypothetical protein [Guptibacillus algicola]|uniref:hypothetical protein n=1 Tax=Guptibacillus algicola TaxID=225844 RepID=UPI001CD6DD50|nr:hypothetical protein [Alkalihalobacillus algicola]MCA0988590.1 hypothetical protein [Alkalihalobacillus algicola]